MILAVLISIVSILNSIDLSLSEYIYSDEFNRYSKVFFLDDIYDRNHFLKSFIGGIFVTICMTGLDQDMMQKNLTCKSIKDAQKNMISFSFVLLFVTALFMFLGALLFTYKDLNGILIPEMGGQIRTDLLFPEIALNSQLGIVLGISFLLGLIAAAYSSADSALTSLTTSFCVDFLNMKSDNTSLGLFSKRTLVHLFVSFLLLCIIILVKYLNNDSIITTLFLLASYTYGPLLGLFVFGIFTNRKIIDKHVPFFIILPPIISYLISRYDTYILNGFDFGPDLIIINGLITFLILFSISKK